MPDLTAKPLIPNGSIMLGPAPNGDMVHGQALFRHHFFQVAVAERVSQILPDPHNDNHVFEVSSSEQGGPFLGHRPRYQIQPRRLQHIRPSPEAE